MLSGSMPKIVLRVHEAPDQPGIAATIGQPRDVANRIVGRVVQAGCEQVMITRNPERARRYRRGAADQRGFFEDRDLRALLVRCECRR
jgi:isopentenyl diphosphate isomerase/L-lactate dehydrogenase-like FMN-dependent dehydrogenase